MIRMPRVLFSVLLGLSMVAGGAPALASNTFDFSWADDAGAFQAGVSRLSPSGDGFSAAGTIDMDAAISSGDSFTLADVVTYSITVRNGATDLFTFTDANDAAYAGFSSIDTTMSGTRSGNDLVFTSFSVAAVGHYFGGANFTIDLTSDIDTVYDDDGDIAGIFNNVGVDENAFFVRFPDGPTHQNSYQATLAGNAVIPTPATALAIPALLGTLGLRRRRRA